MKGIEYVRNLLELKKKNCLQEDKEKIENLEFLLKKDGIFFQLDLDTAVGILDFLGVPHDEIKALYFELISPRQYNAVSKPYVTIVRD